MKTVKVKKSDIREIYGLACDKWKNKLKEGYPDAFEGFVVGDFITLEIGGKVNAIALVTQVGSLKENGVLEYYIPGVEDSFEMRVSGHDGHGPWSFTSNSNGGFRKASAMEIQDWFRMKFRDHKLTREMMHAHYGGWERFEPVEKWYYDAENKRLFSAPSGRGGYIMWEHGEFVHHNLKNQPVRDKREELSIEDAAERFFAAHKDEYKPEK